MQIEIVRNNIQYTQYYSAPERSLSDFDLKSRIATMKRSKSWEIGELNSLVLFKSPGEQIVLTAIHEGTEIESFQSNDSVSFQIIEGELKLHIMKDSITIQKGQLIKLKEHIKYRLTTREETIFLLTISNGIMEMAKN
jgi:quercetin dioxygenase-like cupin family protein